MTIAWTVVSEDYLQDLIASEKRLRAENENLREQLRGEIESHQAMTKAYENEIKMLKEIREITRLRAENEKLREVLNDVTKELDQFVNIFKGYQGMKMNNAQAALRAAAAALNGAVNE